MRFFALVCTLLVCAAVMTADDGQSILTVDHYVPIRSTALASAGQTSTIYVREVVQAGMGLRGATPSDRVALFIHGAGTPAEVAFDVPYQDYSWMGFLARAGYDVFSMDMTGYGRSSRPDAMNNVCNLAKDQQALFPALIKAPCEAARTEAITTIGSDWDDIDAVVNHIRTLRRVDKLNLLGWSQGGPRAGGYAMRHPEKVAKLVLLAPAYNRTMSSEATRTVNGASMNTQSRTEFVANWDRQVGCADQYDRGTLETVWREMVASDPVGATWGTGVRRAPSVPSWGFNKDGVTRMQTPIMMVAGVHDKQVNPDRVRELYSDIGSPNKVFLDLACSSHNAMWERNHLLLFRASLEFLTSGTFNGQKQAMERVGY